MAGTHRGIVFGSLIIELASDVSLFLVDPAVQVLTLCTTLRGKRNLVSNAHLITGQRHDRAPTRSSPMSNGPSLSKPVQIGTFHST